MTTPVRVRTCPVCQGQGQLLVAAPRTPEGAPEPVTLACDGCGGRGTVNVDDDED